MLSASIWTTNIRSLDRKIKRISFEELRHPTVEINSQLHDCREDLARLREDVTETRKYMPSTVAEWHSKAFARMPYHKSTPKETLEEVMTDSTTISQFLMDSFQLLMSTVSTLDSQTSLQQARRGAQLTKLAFIYVPLSFVTGIFGMNLKELNGSGPSAWIPAVSLFIVIVCTAAILWLLGLVPQRKSRSKSRKEKEV